MAQLIKLLVVKRNGKTLTYPTYEDINPLEMEGIVSLSTGGSRFTALSKRVIPVVYEVEQTISQIKALANQPGTNVSA